ncbi:MAG TPA: hypothetical protein VGG77_07150 [Roseiarcus sp.]|jgi:hypothetical protein
MTITLNGTLSRCLAGPALAGLIAFTSVPPAMAQWLPPPWRAAFPGEIARSLEARGYVLTAPLLRRPGIYIADVSAGPAGYERLIIDARSGQILESFPASGRMWGPALAARGEAFGEPAPSGAGGPPLNDEFSSVPRPPRTTKPSSGAPGGAHMPAAISPYGPTAAPLGTKPKPKVASTEHKIPGTRTPITNPPLPPPAPREAAKAEEPAPPTSQPAVIHGPDQPRVESPPAEADNVPPATPPTPEGSSAEASDKAKVSIVPPAPFE